MSLIKEFVKGFLLAAPAALTASMLISLRDKRAVERHEAEYRESAAQYLARIRADRPAADWSALKVQRGSEKGMSVRTRVKAPAPTPATLPTPGTVLRRCLDTVLNSPNPVTPYEVAFAMKHALPSVRTHLSQLTRSGHITRLRPGIFGAFDRTYTYSQI